MDGQTIPQCGRVFENTCHGKYNAKREPSATNPWDSRAVSS